jgi:hypothetical protein
MSSALSVEINGPKDNSETFIMKRKELLLHSLTMTQLDLLSPKESQFTCNQ